MAEEIVNPFLELIRSQKFSEIQEAFKAQKPAPEVTPQEALSQYKIDEHDIFDETLRPKKTIKKDTGSVNAAGEPVLATTQVDVARVAMPFQKLIVDRRVGFMLSEPVYAEVQYGDDSEQEKELLRAIEMLMNDNKMDYKNKEVARRMMSELEVAEIWYFVENKTPLAESKFTMKMKILSPELGDELYPMFDTSGDMIAFARAYKIKEDKKDIDHYDVYTTEFEYKYANRGTWELDTTVSPNPIPNAMGKIPIIYYTQKYPEWADVQSMISRMEVLVSNHADTNDYFGSPILAITGELYGYAQKGESGKILQLAQGAQANYLALASEPNSIKMEQDNLEKFIYTMSQTPNITFENMKGLGVLSGVALRLLFLDAHMAVKTKEEIFGIGLQRRYNLIKAAIGKVINTKLDKVAEITQIKPVITPYIPQNEVELLDNLTVAINSGIISKESAVGQNPLVEDPEEELDKINGEKEESIAQEQEMFSQAALPQTGTVKAGKSNTATITE